MLPRFETSSASHSNLALGLLGSSLFFLFARVVCSIRVGSCFLGYSRETPILDVMRKRFHYIGCTSKMIGQDHTRIELLVLFLLLRWSCLCRCPAKPPLARRRGLPLQCFVPSHRWWYCNGRIDASHLFANIQITVGVVRTAIYLDNIFVESSVETSIVVFCMAMTRDNSHLCQRHFRPASAAPTRPFCLGFEFHPGCFQRLWFYRHWQCCCFCSSVMMNVVVTRAVKKIMKKG